MSESSLRKVSLCISENPRTCTTTSSPYFFIVSWSDEKIQLLLLFFIKPPQRHLSYAIAILELLQYSSTFGVPDSVYARNDIVSNTCYPAPCYLNSSSNCCLAIKYFYFRAINFVIPSGALNPGPSMATISWEIACRLRRLGRHGR